MINYKMLIEGDGETRRYGLRIETNTMGFVFRDIEEDKMESLLRDLVNQFIGLKITFDRMEYESENTCGEVC